MTTITIARPLTQDLHNVTTATSRTHWIDVVSGDRLSRPALAELRRKAHLLYQANTHIFEDERDALGALGAVPQFDLAV
jgi:hypothetical protein